MKNKTEIPAENHSLMKISQKAIIYDPSQDKFLIARVAEHGNFYHKYGPWEFFGGRLHVGEDMQEALGREIKEEAGDIEFRIEKLVANKIISGLRGETMFLGYLVIFQGGEIELSHEHDKYAWESAENIKNSTEYKSWFKEFIAAADKYVKNEQYLEGWKRCQADFENFKKRQADSQKDLIRYSTQNIILQILPVIDNFHASTDHIPEDQKENPWVTGIMYIQKQLEQVLAENGVEEIGAKKGDNFDPAFHEAVEDKECKSCKSKDYKFQNKIKKVVVRGYKIDDKVIRAARVIVE